MLGKPFQLFKKLSLYPFILNTAIQVKRPTGDKSFTHKTIFGTELYLDVTVGARCFCSGCLLLIKFQSLIGIRH